MRNMIEGFILKQNAKAVCHINPSNFQSGAIHEVNKQIERDFGLVGPLVLSQPSLRVHQLRWAMVREVFVVSTHVSRLEKELVASGVSSSNICPYCVDVHETSMRSIGADDSKQVNSLLMEWSLNTKNPHAEIIKNPPFVKEQAPEIIGTALEFHSTNRLVSIFLEESPLPSAVISMGMKKMALFMASKTFFKTMVMKQAKAGEAEKFLNKQVPDANYVWAEAVPLYGLIRRNNIKLLEDMECDFIPQAVASMFKAVVVNWQGEDMPLGRAWVNGLTKELNQEEKVMASVMLLAAFAPHTITDDDMLRMQYHGFSDSDIIELCFWAIQILTFRIETWLAAPFIKQS